MPIRPERKGLYPPGWKAISLAVRENAGWKCEECGVQNGQLGGRLRDGAWLPAVPAGRDGAMPRPGSWAWCSDGRKGDRLRIVKIVLTVAHLDHDPGNCDRSNLRAWCQRCHLTYDAKSKAERRRLRERLSAADRDLFDAE